MKSIFRGYSPLLICGLCYYYLLSSHPIDFSIPTQYIHHKTVSSELALALSIVLNTNNLATEKVSSGKPFYNLKSGKWVSMNWQHSYHIRLGAILQYFHCLCARTLINISFYHTDDKS